MRRASPLNASLYRFIANGVHMSNANHLGATISEIARARELVGQLRGTVSGSGADVLDQLEQSLFAASESASSAASLMQRQSQHLAELSAMVVGSTSRHF